MKLGNLTTIIKKISAGIGIAFFIMMLLAFPVMWLWNYSLSAIVDGVNNISLGQSLALLILINLLFRTLANKE